MKKTIQYIVLFLCIATLSGCALIQKGKKRVETEQANTVKETAVIQAEKCEAEIEEAEPSGLLETNPEEDLEIEKEIIVDESNQDDQWTIGGYLEEDPWNVGEFSAEDFASGEDHLQEKPQNKDESQAEDTRVETGNRIDPTQNATESQEITIGEDDEIPVEDPWSVGDF